MKFAEGTVVHGGREAVLDRRAEKIVFLHTKTPSDFSDLRFVISDDKVNENDKSLMISKKAFSIYHKRGANENILFEKFRNWHGNSQNRDSGAGAAA
ncbi:MAG: hypothetical protein ACSW75_05250, partial [Lachnospiraceae bacterium]